jgi:hypothetical protein
LAVSAKKSALAVSAKKGEPVAKTRGAPHATAPCPRSQARAASGAAPPRLRSGGEQRRRRSADVKSQRYQSGRVDGRCGT